MPPRSIQNCQSIARVMAGRRHNGKGANGATLFHEKDAFSS
ncbi:hypothetical protein EBBID32_25170 [Sphingobium indicum BiD32]|uniref:Uncharacterized protein n=1 Tax=Sphingobium indicum BiD32 TaxID=1301087 RepID=N1MMI5_9SPHN|nr:hypothetical protein EBBID32_25170 [Sphingobium indicum BiD32]